MEKKWRAVRAQLPQLEQLIHTTPIAYQHRLLGELAGYLWQWDTAEELRQFLPGAYTLSRRLATPPFRADIELSHVLGSFLDNQQEQLREDFLSAPDTSFHTLEKCCRRKNDARLIARGAYSLIQFFPDLAVRTFVRFPRQLCKTAKVLGTLRYEYRATLLQQITHHTFFTTDFPHVTPRDAYLAIQQVCEDDIGTPFHGISLPGRMERTPSPQLPSTVTIVLSWKILTAPASISLNNK